MDRREQEIARLRRGIETAERLAETSRVPESWLRIAEQNRRDLARLEAETT